MGLILLIIPFVLTIWNISAFIIYAVKKAEPKHSKFLELGALLLGAFYLYIYIHLFEIELVPWHEQLYNNQLHCMVAPETFLTIMVLSVVAFLGYLLIRFTPIKNQSPLVSALGIAAVYIGIAICLVWCVQTFSDLFLVLFPANAIVLFIKAIYILVYEKNALIKNQEVSLKYKKLSEFLNNATNLPLAALLLLLPLLGLIVVILFLFGQEPNSVIKAWTETADWTLSQKIAPQNIHQDEHYLCTVAAGGHREVVKPIRTGIRHNHRVIVNRQLCIANAFEQILEEKTPRFHKMVREFYDRTGYPISKHINSKFLADAVYFLMKPLEWIFLIVLYLVDVNPEDRIAVQYPHSKKPAL